MAIKVSMAFSMDSVATDSGFNSGEALPLFACIFFSQSANAIEIVSRAKASNSDEQTLVVFFITYPLS